MATQPHPPPPQAQPVQGVEQQQGEPQAAEGLALVDEAARVGLEGVRVRARARARIRATRKGLGGRG